MVEWTEDNRIKASKEFGCNRNTYNPYQESDTHKKNLELKRRIGFRGVKVNNSLCLYADHYCKKETMSLIHECIAGHK